GRHETGASGRTRKRRDRGDLAQLPIPILARSPSTLRSRGWNVQLLTPSSAKLAVRGHEFFDACWINCSRPVAVLFKFRTDNESVGSSEKFCQSFRGDTGPKINR